MPVVHPHPAPPHPDHDYDELVGHVHHESNTGDTGDAFIACGLLIFAVLLLGLIVSIVKAIFVAIMEWIEK